MKSTPAVALTLLVVVGGMCAGILMLPALEPSALRLVRSPELAQGAERARRLLMGFDPDLQRLGESAPSAEAPGGEEFEAAYQRELEAVAGLLGGGIVNESADGALSGVVRTIEENAQKLESSLSSVRSALGTTVGDAKGEDVAYVQRLFGAILYAKGLSDSWRAQTVRSELAQLEGKIRVASAEAVRMDLYLATATTDLFGSQAQKIRDAIKGQESAAAELDRLKQDNELRASALVKQFETAQSQAMELRSKMEALEAVGIDFGNPQGAEVFAEQYAGLAAEYRKAIREAQIAEFGTLPHAAPDEVGGVLEGRYLEQGQPGKFTLQFGLRHFQAETGRIQAALVQVSTAIQAMQEQLAQYEAGQASAEEEHNEVRRMRSEADAKIEELAADWKTRRARMREFEDAATQAFEQSSKALTTASNLVDKFVQSAGQRLRTVPSELQSFSAHKAGTDLEWVASQLLAEASRSLAGKATIVLQRIQSDRAAAALLRDYASVSSSLASAATELETVAAEEESALELALSDSIEMLERAASRGSLRNNWTFVAQMANLGSLMLVAGDSAVLSQVLANYRAAIQGREDQQATAAIKSRIDFLSNS